MIIFPRRKNRIRGVAHVIGGGFHSSGAGIFDWLGNVASRVGNFVSSNSNLIKGVASTIADVGKAGVSTASSIKQIVDLAKSRKTAPVPAASTPAAASAVSPALQNALNQKGVDILNNAMGSTSAAGSACAGAGLYLGKQSDGWGARAAGSGHVSAANAHGRGLYLGKQSDGW